MAPSSLASGQQPITDSDITYPLTPPLTEGCPETSSADTQVPLEVTYEYDQVNPDLFTGVPTPGLERWAPLLPPLAGSGLKAGATPLIEVPSLAEWADVQQDVYLKDESRNPTWSHKDRLNRLTVGAAQQQDARGVVASSTGNHGASAAAHAAELGLPAIVVTNEETPSSMLGFMRAYGAAVLRVEGWDNRMRIVNQLAEQDFHAVTSRTAVHTGHPYGPEGYKTIAYELNQQLDTVPGEIYVPTAHAELLYGVWKGFREMSMLDVIDNTPRMVACEPGPQAALVEARRRRTPIVEIEAGESAAHSIGGSRSTHRGYFSLEESDGFAIPVPESTLSEAQSQASRVGFWQELSGTASLGGLRETDRQLDGPVVVLGCSSGFKDAGEMTAPLVDPELDAVVATLNSEYNLDLDL